MRKSKNIKKPSQKQNPYKQKKRQVQQIMSRIDKKMSLQIFLQRSEGSLIQNQLKYELEKLKKKKARSNTILFPTQIRVPVTQRKIQTQSPARIAKSIKRSMQNQIDQQNTGELRLIKNEQNLQKLQVIEPISNETNLNMLYLKKIKTNFRPQLQQLSKYLSVTEKTILQRRRKIIQLIILCLMRRCHKKIYQAFDIAIQLSSYFQQNDTQTILKSICLKLIGKLYKQIRLQQNRKKISIKVQNKNTIKFKRHSSFVIKTLSSQRVFFTKFTHKYNKSKLLKQTNYQRQLLALYPELDTKQKIKQKQQQNQTENKKVNEKIVMLRITDKVAISVPPPQRLFLQTQNANNYNIIIHNRNLQSADKLFPLQYPYSIKHKIYKKQYFYLISKTNSIIFTQTQCFKVQEVFKQVGLQIFFILFLILLIIVRFSINFDAKSGFDWFTQLLIVIMLIFTCYNLIFKSSDSIGLSQRHEKLENQLKKWNQKYQKQNIIFKTIQNCGALIICSLNNQIQSSQQSNYGADTINQSSIISSHMFKSVKLQKQSEHNIENLAQNQSNNNSDSNKDQHIDSNKDEHVDSQQDQYQLNKKQKYIHQIKDILIIGQDDDNYEQINNQDYKQQNSQIKSSKLQCKSEEELCSSKIKQIQDFKSQNEVKNNEKNTNEKQKGSIFKHLYGRKRKLDFKNIQYNQNQAIINIKNLGLQDIDLNSQSQDEVIG